MKEVLGSAYDDHGVLVSTITDDNLEADVIRPFTAVRSSNVSSNPEEEYPKEGTRLAWINIVAPVVGYASKAHRLSDCAFTALVAVRLSSAGGPVGLSHPCPCTR